MNKALSGLTLASLLCAASVAEAREVRVYSGRHYNTDRAVFEGFTQKTGINVRVVEAKGMALVERLKREGSTSKADVILLVDAARINNAAQLDLLQPVASASLTSAVPSNYRDPQNRWFGLTRRVRAIVINPNQVQAKAISSYGDLAKPEFKGKLCLRKRNNVYNQSLVADQIILKGESQTRSWIKGMIDNIDQPFFSGDSSLIRAVAQGRCGIGVVNHYYLARMQAGASGEKDRALVQSTRLIMPDPAHVNISAGAVTTAAKNKQEAIALLEYLASAAGSSALASRTYEYPLRGTGSSSQLKAFGPFTADNVSISRLGETHQKAIRLMAETGWK